jgi:hypothetical protein
MSKDIKVDVGEAKKSIQTRTALAALIGTRISGSTLCQAQSSVKGACTDVVSAGTMLATRDAEVKDAEAKLAAKREAREVALVAFDGCFDFMVAGVEKHATSGTDLTDLALTQAGRKNYLLVPPLGIDVAFDVAARVIALEVKLPPGATTCFVEFSATPADPASWRRVPGHGSRRSLAGFAPGTYWFRALCSRGNEDSDYADAVSVLVK